MNVVPRYYITGAPMEYVIQTTKSKLYFAALALKDLIFPRLPPGAVIQHGLGESYYKGLVFLRKAHELNSLCMLADRAQVKDSDFAAVLADSDVLLPHDEEAPSEAVTPLALEWDGLCPDVDAEAIRRISAQVLSQVDVAMVDISSHILVEHDGLQFKTLFDNCSSSSGKQRAYIMCPLGGARRVHCGCFRYATVEHFDSYEHAAAFLTVWALEATRHDASEFDKLAHRYFKPRDADVAEIRAKLEGP